MTVSDSERAVGIEYEISCNNPDSYWSGLIGAASYSSSCRIESAPPLQPLDLAAATNPFRGETPNLQKGGISPLTGVQRTNLSIDEYETRMDLARGADGNSKSKQKLQ